MQINPYESDPTQGSVADQRRGGSVVVKICVVISFLICTPLVLLACWAWWEHWAYQRVPPGVGSFPYGAFARQTTQWAVVGCASVFALWSAFWLICWGKTRAT